MDREWRAQDDMRVLRQAEEIKADKTRMKAAASMADKEIKALARVSSRAKPTPKGKR